LGYCRTIEFSLNNTVLLSQRNWCVFSLRYYEVCSHKFRRETYEHLQEWLEEVKANGNASMQVILIGNKIDLEKERQVSTEEGRNFAKKEGLKFL